MQANDAKSGAAGDLEGSTTEAEADAANGPSSEAPGSIEQRATMAGPATDPPRAVRPPVLASEALRRDLRPGTPGRGAMRILAIALGAAGTGCLAPFVTIDRTVAPMAGAFAALALLGVVPMPYAARASAIATIAASASVVVTWNRLEAAGAPESVLLDIGIALLAAGLAFRAWHRASILARVMVAGGVLMCAGWLHLTHTFRELIVLDPAWQAWLPRVSPLGLVLCLMLSLLAFMGARSTGGASAWAATLLGWYALHQWVGLLVSAWPLGVATPSLARLDPRVAVAGVASPLLTALVAVGIAQLLAVARRDEPGA